MALALRFETTDLITKIKLMQNFDKVMEPAMKKTSDFMESQVAKSIAARYSLSQKEVKKSTKPSFKTNPLLIMVTVKRERYSLGRFATKAKSIKNASIKKKAKRVASKPGGGLPFYAGTTIGGNVHFIKRKEKERTPIEILRTLSPAHMATQPEVVEESVYDNTMEALMKNIVSQFKRFKI